MARRLAEGAVQQLLRGSQGHALILAARQVGQALQGCQRRIARQEPQIRSVRCASLAHGKTGACGPRPLGRHGDTSSLDGVSDRARCARPCRGLRLGQMPAASRGAPLKNPSIGTSASSNRMPSGQRPIMRGTPRRSRLRTAMTRPSCARLRDRGPAPGGELGQQPEVDQDNAPPRRALDDLRPILRRHRIPMPPLPHQRRRAPGVPCERAGGRPTPDHIAEIRRWRGDLDGCSMKKNDTLSINKKQYTKHRISVTLCLMPNSTSPASSHRLRQAMQLRGIG